MLSMYQNIKPNTKVVGNDYASDDSLGFKQEVQAIIESYGGMGGANLLRDMGEIIGSPENKEALIDSVCESVTTSPLFTTGDIANEAFYDNYGQRMAQLLDNSLRSVATESAMLGYAPIVAYNPFFLKKQWISCIFKDVLMTEVPQSPVINLAFEKRYLKDQEGNEYPIPEVNYDDEVMQKLYDCATGLNITSDIQDIKNYKPAKLILDTTLIPGLTPNDPTAELTIDFKITKVYMEFDPAKDIDGGLNGAHPAVGASPKPGDPASDNTTDQKGVYEVPCNITVDVTTHQLINGHVKYDVLDEDGNLLCTLEDNVIGNVDFKSGKALIMSESDKVTHFVMSGKTANRWNNRSLDVVRRVERLEFVMPESGPRLNAAVTVEDASDALALQKVDVIADNVDVMGRTLAEFEDFEIRTYLEASFQAQEAAGVGPHGYDKMTVTGGFDALPFDSFSNNVTDWMADSREYFERILEELKDKLKTEKAATTVVCHPSLVRFLQKGINWVFENNQTEVGGMKISYSFGVYTTAQDKVHIITTRYMKKEQGLKFIVIPLTNELITYKHYKYNCVIDRNYRNPIYTLVPNIMCTQRTLTFEVLPVQGKMTIDGRDLFSPQTLKREDSTEGEGPKGP